MKAAEDLIKSKTYEFGGYRLEAESLSLFRGEKIVQLPPKTIEVLLALVESGGRVVSREEINERVWADTFVEEANLTHHVSALRKIFNETGGQFIETVPRRGYRFVADVREIAADQAAATTEIELNERTTTRFVEEEIEIADALQPNETFVPSKPTAPKKIEPKKSRQRIAAVAILSIVALAGIGFAFYKFLNPAPAKFEAKKTTRLTASGRVKVAAVAPDGKFIVYSQEEFDGRQSLWTQHVGSDSKAQIAAPAAIEYYGLNISPDGNSVYFINEKGTAYRMPVLGGAAKKIAENLFVFTSVTGIAVSPDNKRIAYVRRLDKDKTVLFSADVNGANERTVAAFDDPIKIAPAPSWSPDGETIATRIQIEGMQNIVAVRVADGTHAVLMPQSWTVMGKTLWLPDSKNLLALGSTDALTTQVYRVNRLNGEISPVVEEANRCEELSLSADGRSLALIKTEQIAHIWTMPGAGEASQARQLTAGFQKFDGVTSLHWLPDGRILYDSAPHGDYSTWAVEASGNAGEILKGGDSEAVSPDGSFMVYRKPSAESGEWYFYRMNLSDGGERLLTKKSGVWTTVSPDGKWVVYTRYSERTGVWKVSAEGGEPLPVLNENATSPAISPDGKIIAFIWRRAGHPNQIALASFNGGEVIKTFDTKPEINPLSDKQNLQWTPDGRGIYFVSNNNGASNIWQQPVDGSPPVQVTNFKDGRIFNFAFSADGKQLALSRGTFNSDVVLIENAQ